MSTGGGLRQETRRDGWPVHASAEPPFIHSSDPPFPFDQFIRFDHSIGPILSLICCPHIFPPHPFSCHHRVGKGLRLRNHLCWLIDFFEQSNVVFTIYPNTQYQLLALSGSLTWPDLLISSNNPTLCYHLTSKYKIPTPGFEWVFDMARLIDFFKQSNVVSTI